MSADMPNQTLEDAADPNKLARRNAILLAVAQAFNGSTAALCISMGGLAGLYLLGDDKSLATAPVTTYNIGVALGALPAAMLMRKVGRRMGFIGGSLIGIAGALLTTGALFAHSFWLFCLGTVLYGASGSFTQQFRFAAADQGLESFKPKAISWVLAGGVFAGIIGPQTVIYAKDLFEPVKFAGAFLAGAGLLIIGIIVLSQLKFAQPQSQSTEDDPANSTPARPLSEIMAQPRFIVAVMCAVGAYALMSFVMTAAPLAMVGHGIHINDATLGIQWHVLAMFGPSFFTGNLIARFGKEKIVATGFFILIASALVALNGVGLWQFWTSLVLLGLGWNFGFIGATAMLTETYRPNEKSKAQGANDFILFGSVALASLMSGLTLNFVGWEMINTVVFPVVIVCLLSLIWLSTRANRGLA